MRTSVFIFFIFLSVFMFFSQSLWALDGDIKKNNLEDAVLPVVLKNEKKARSPEETTPLSESGSPKIGSVSFEDKTFTLKEKLDVDPNTGSSTAAVPFEVPSGRAGVQPSLSLLYNSHGVNGFVGVGWVLEAGCIRRSAKFGVPSYTNTDSFLLIQAGSQQELVDISQNNTEFRAKNEGAFMKFEFLPNHTWVATDRKGIKYYFGTTASSQTFDPQNTNKIFQWSLDRVEDLSGNYMTISYIKEDNQVYPDQIDYTGNSVNVLMPFASVNFIYEARPDQLMMHISGFKIETKKRLKAVDIFVGTSRVRKYILQYDQGFETGRSRLISVTQYGSDGTTSLPPTIFSYSQGQTDFNSAVNISNHPVLGFNSSRLTHLMDMNGDGRPDIVHTTIGQSNAWQIYFNNGQGNFSAPVTAVNSPTWGTDNPDVRFYDFNGDGLMDVIAGDPYQIWMNNGVNGFNPPTTVSISTGISLTHFNLIQFLDMNRDGKTDMVRTYQGNNNTWDIYYSNGQGDFSAAVPAVNSPIRGADNPDLRFYDFNGDGLLDVIYGDPLQIWMNNGVNGFKPPTTVSVSTGISISHQNLTQFIDMNNDGLVDMVRSYPGTNNSWDIYFNNGKGDFEAPIQAINSPVPGMDNGDMKLIDINRDGLVDVIWGQAAAPWYASLNNGRNGFRPSITIPTPSSYPHSITDPDATHVDINGDDLPDLFCGKDGQPYKVWFHALTEKSSSPDVLVNIDNSIGAETEIEYQNLPIQGLWGPAENHAFGATLFNSVKKTTKNLSTGESYLSCYEYAGGLWDHPEREFRGFLTAKVIDPDGNYSISYFLQDDIYKGRPQRQETYDANGNLYSKSVSTWNNQQLYPGVYFPYLEQSDSFIYDGNATGRRTQEKYFYAESPQYGNVTKVIQMGEVDLVSGSDIGADMRTVETEYHNNTGGNNWLLGIPKQVVAKDHANTEVRKTWFYYDGSSNVNTLPIKGQLTKKELWGGSGLNAVNPTIEYTYDVYGNLLTTKDPNSHTSSIIYDGTYHMFPLQATNAKNHSVLKEYYGVNGVPLDDGMGYHGLWGQVKSVQDPNSQQGKKTYDVFGRLTAAVSPLDSISFPTSSVEYAFLNNGVKITTHQREKHGQPETLDSTSFYDGMGRLIQSKSESGHQGEFTVSGQTEYNSRGLPIKKHAPFFSVLPVDTLEAINLLNPYTTITYDAMGRVIQTTHPDGSYSSVIYDDWTTSTFDENGHKQTSHADAYGRLIRKEEYFGADGRDSHYPSQAYSLYATTLYSYDSEGNLIQVQDAHGNITTISYDNLGRKISMNDPDMGLWQYAYDPAGNLTWQKDAKNQEITFSYDEINRLTNKTDGALLNVNYSYDTSIAPPASYSVGRLAKASYATTGKANFVYDALGRENFSKKTIDAIDYSVARTYDAADRLNELTYPDNSSVLYTYNSAGQIDGIGSTTDNFPMPSKNGAGKFEGQNTLALKKGIAFPLKKEISSAKPASYKDLLFSSKVTKGGKGPGQPKTGATVDISASPSQPIKGVRQDYTITLSWDTNFNPGQCKLFCILLENNTGMYLSGAHDWGSIPPGPWDAENMNISTNTGSVTIVKDLEAYSTLLGQPINNFIWVVELRLVNVNMTYDPNNNSTYYVLGRKDVNVTANTDPQFLASVNPQNPHPAVLADYNFNFSWTNLPMNLGYDYRLFYTLVENTTGHYYAAAQDPVTSNTWLGGNIDIADGNPVGSYAASKSLTAFSEYGGAPITGYSWVAQIRRVAPGQTYDSANPQTFIAMLEKIMPAQPGSGLNVTLEADYYRPILNYKKQYQFNFSWDNAIPTFNDQSYDYKYYITILDADSNYLAATTTGGQWWAETGNISQAAPNTISVTKDLTVANNDGSFPNTDKFIWVGELRRYPQGNTTTYAVLSKVTKRVEGKTLGSYIYVNNVEYNASGQITEIEYGNKTKTIYTYDPNTFRLANLLTVDKLNQPLQNFSYTYDSVGNILTITDAVHTGTQAFAYDPLSRLVWAQGSYGIKSYSYDEIGNILSKEGISFAYSQVGAGPHAVTGLSDGTTFTYDANGNMVTMQKGTLTWQYSYDVENRLKGVKKNNLLQAKFEYDGDGGRVKRTTCGSMIQPINNYPPTQMKGFFDISKFGANKKPQPNEKAPINPPPPPIMSTTTRYIGSLYELDGGSALRYVYLGSTRIAQVRNGQVMYYHADHLGGANVLTEGSGSVKEICEYLPFGGFSRHDKYGTNQEVALFYFTGKELDDKTGLYYYGARYYNPLIGRFITPDFVVEAAVNPQMLNRYSYCGNNPVNISDPSGHFWFFAAIAAIFKAAATYAIAHPIIAGAAMGGLLGGVNSAISGTNIGQGIGLGILSGMIGGGVGLGVGDFMKAGVGNFWSGMAAAGAGGSSAGAAVNGVGGGDAGIGALAGLAGGIAGFMGSYNLAPLAGDILGSAASAAVSGSNMGDSMLGGLVNSGVSATVGMLLPDPTIGEQNPQPGDLIFYKAGADLSGAVLAPIQGAAKGHDAIAVGGGYQSDSHIDGGVNMRKIDSSRQGRVVKWAGSGNQKFIALAVQYGKESSIGYWLGPNREICSTFVGRVAGGAGLSVPGFSPSSQYNNIQGIQYRNTYTYGVQK